MYDRAMHGPTHIDRYPAPWRLVLAFVIAPLFGATVLTILELGWSTSSAKLIGSVQLLSIGAFPAAALFGLPAYFVLRRIVAPSLLNCAVVGAVVAVLPGLLLGLLPMSEHFQFSIGGRATVVNGHQTAWGWELWRASLLKTAVAGLAGGAVFWAFALFRFTAPKSA
jgi:hypothetical protein